MIPTRSFALIYSLLIAAGLYIHAHSDITVPINRSFGQFPLKVQGWQMLSEAQFSEGVLNVLRPSDYLYRTYGKGGDHAVQLYIGYHGGGKETGGIHSPKHCLPGSGWYEESTRRTTMTVAGQKVNMVEAVYQKGEDQELFLYWFQVKDRSLSDEYSLKASEIINSLLYRRRDSAFIRISMPVQGSIEQTKAVAVQFLNEFYPTIMGHLPA